MKKPIITVLLFMLFFSNLQIANAAIAKKSYTVQFERVEKSKKVKNDATPVTEIVKKKTDKAAKSQVVALILAILVGVFGVHRFYLGYKGRGMLMLLLSTVGSILFGIGLLVSFVLTIMDIIGIASEELGPADGSEYTQKL